MVNFLIEINIEKIYTRQKYEILAFHSESAKNHEIDNITSHISINRQD